MQSVNPYVLIGYAFIFHLSQSKHHIVPYFAFLGIKTKKEVGDASTHEVELQSTVSGLMITPDDYNYGSLPHFLLNLV
jgi:hypothetical protein